MSFLLDGILFIVCGSGVFMISRLIYISLKVNDRQEK